MLTPFSSPSSPFITSFRLKYTHLAYFFFTLYYPESLSSRPFSLQIHAKPYPLFFYPLWYPLWRTILILFLFKSTQNLAILPQQPSSPYIPSVTLFSHSFLFKYTQNLIHCSFLHPSSTFDALFSLFSSSNTLKTLLTPFSSPSSPFITLSHSLLVLFLFKYTQNLIHCSLYPLWYPLWRTILILFLFKSLKTLLSFLSNLLHPIFPQSLSFLILFSSNTLKTLSIVPFYTLLVPLTHYSHSFPLQIHSKPCLHPSHLLLHPLLPWVTLFSSFFSSNTRKTLSIVLLPPLISPLTHYSHSFPLQVHSKPCYPSSATFFTLYSLSHSLFSFFSLQIHSKPYPLFLFTPF